MNNRFVLSGGPGGGKSTLLTALAERGYHVVPESARAIIRDRLQAGLAPRPEPATFARDIFRQDAKQYRALQADRTPAFFDRGVLDALYMMHSAGALEAGELERHIRAYPYSRAVFFLPPWQEIYLTDSERDQTFAEAQVVFEDLKRWYLRWGYDVIEVPRCSVDERLAFILETVGQTST